MTLNEAIPNWYNYGIFTALHNNTISVLPWKDEINDEWLNLFYHGNRSGDKLISPLCKYYTDKNNNTLSETDLINISNIIVTYNVKNWIKLYNTLNLAYNPIDNTDVTEDYTDKTVNTGTVNNINNLIHGKKTESTNQSTGEQNNNIYGFNTTTKVPTNANVGTSNTQDVSTDSGTDTENDTRTDNLTSELTHTLRRHGNIGVTTSQQMIEAERKMWFWKFFNQIFEDIDLILTIPVYGG